LNHFETVEVAFGGNDTLDDAVLQAERIADGGNGHALLQRVRIAQGQGS
jgi:hypothetical protein